MYTSKIPATKEQKTIRNTKSINTAPRPTPPPSPSPLPSPPPPYLALPARHVVTPLILLDPRLALGALLRVGQDPVRRLALILALLLPPRQFVARGRVVGLLPAAEAEHGPALAPHAARVAERRLDHHVAVLPGAEPQRLVDVHEAREGEGLIALQLLRGNELREHGLARDLRTLVLRTRRVHTRRPLVHLFAPRSVLAADIYYVARAGGGGRKSV